VPLYHPAGITRPALCLERLSTNATEQVTYALKVPSRHGTSLDSSEHASNERREPSAGRKPIPDVSVEKTR